MADSDEDVVGDPMTYESALLIVVSASERFSGEAELLEDYRRPGDRKAAVDQRGFAQSLNEMQATDPARFDALVRGGSTGKGIRRLLETSKRVTACWLATNQVDDPERFPGDFLPLAELLSVAVMDLFPGVGRQGVYELASYEPSSPGVETTIRSALHDSLQNGQFDLVVVGSTGGGSLRNKVIEVAAKTVPLWCGLLEIIPNRDDPELRRIPRQIDPLDVRDLGRLVADSIRFGWEDLAETMGAELDEVDSSVAASYRVIKALRGGSEPDPADVAALPGLVGHDRSRWEELLLEGLSRTVSG